MDFNLDKKLGKNEIWELNTINNIYHIRLDIFHSFILVLIDDIFKTFPGFDVINTIAVKTQHFEYCLKRTIDKFKMINIHFDLTQKAKTLFYTYFLTNFYINSNISDSDEGINFTGLKNEIIADWGNILKYYSQKTKGMYDKFKIIYNAMEESMVFTY